MILLWGLPGDGPLRAVHASLRSLGEPVCLLDQHAIKATTLDLSVGTTVQGALQIGGETIAMEAITAVYARPYDVRQLPELLDAGVHSKVWQHGLALDDALQAWVEVTPALVINRPSAMASNSSKPYQAALIRAAGFDVPDTLVTTDPNAALEFRDLHESVIYKSTSGVRSIVSRLGLVQQQRFADICNCPTQFQQYIAGTDFRVHVVGNRVFASEIVTEAEDYRYAARSGHSIGIRAYALETELVERCRRLATALDLPFAGIDLRRTQEGRWYCFEVNPSPGFTFYQEATGQRIAEAVAILLAGSA